MPHADYELIGVLNEYPAVDVPGGVQIQLGDAYGGERRRLGRQRLCLAQVLGLGSP